MDEALKSLTTLLSLLVVPLFGAIGYLYRSNKAQVSKLQSDHDTCQRKLARFEVDLARTHSWIESRYGDDFGDAVIVVDADSGLITEWNPSATVMFHWTQRESLGKSITKLIPARYLDQHQKAWGEWKGSGHAPRRGPFSLHAMTKDGDEVAILMLLSGWGDGGKRIVAANIRKREE